MKLELEWSECQKEMERDSPRENPLIEPAMTFQALSLVECAVSVRGVLQV